MLSIWEKQSFLQHDYIIVGSGILGLSVACEIKERIPSKQVLIVERGFLPAGASTKNAGFLCFGSLTEILADIKAKGEQNAVELVNKRWQGISILKKRLGEKNIGFLNYGGYELIDSEHQNAPEKIDYVNELLTEIFPGPVFSLKNECIAQFGFNENIVNSLVFSPYESQVDTGEMMKTLLKYTRSLGVQIINGCEVKNVSNGKVEVFHSAINETFAFESDHIIICANAFVNKLFPEIKVKPGRGQVIATKPVGGLKFKGIFHIDEGYYYFRNYGSRVIFGGGRNLDFEGETTVEFGPNSRIIDDLKHKLDTVILPGADYEIEYRWSGIMGFTENRLPLIQKTEPKTIVAISCNGMGVALSGYIAREIVNSIFP